MPPFHIGVAELFQSTLPLRGATSPTRWNPRQSNFNPHSPCGERLHRPYRGRRQPISIHTPLAGSDSEWSRMYTLPLLFQSTLPLRGATKVSKPNAIKSLFQSTLPLRGATRHLQLGRERRQISIHTPLAGSDTPPCVLSAAVIDFNPHSPCGERPRTMRRSSPCHSYFNPHSPCGERLEFCELVGSEVEISIHTPLAGSDLVKSAMHDLTS